MANQLLEEDKLRNITSADYLTILSELSGSEDESRANTFRQLTKRPGTFSLGSGGLATSLKSAMALRDDEIEAEVLRRQREAITDGTIKKLGGGIKGQMAWWNASGLPNQFATKARTVFQSIQGETFQEAARGEAELAADYAKSTADRASLEESERIAVDAGISEIFTAYSSQYSKAAEVAGFDPSGPTYDPTWQTLEASIRNKIYGSKVSESVKNAIFEGAIERLRTAYDPVGRFEVEQQAASRATAKREEDIFPSRLIISEDKALTIENKAAVDKILGYAGVEATRLTEGIEDQTSYLSAREELELWLDKNADVELLGGPERDRILSAFEKRNKTYAKPIRTYSQEEGAARLRYQQLFSGMLSDQIMPGAPSFSDWLLGDKTFMYQNKPVDGWLREQRLIGSASHFAVEPMIGYARDAWTKGPVGGWLEAPTSKEDIGQQAIDWYNRLVAIAEDLVADSKMSSRMKDRILKELGRLYKERVGAPLPGTPFGGS